MSQDFAAGRLRRRPLDRCARSSRLLSERQMRVLVPSEERGDARRLHHARREAVRGDVQLSGRDVPRHRPGGGRGLGQEGDPTRRAQPACPRAVSPQHARLDARPRHSFRRGAQPGAEQGHAGHRRRVGFDHACRPRRRRALDRSLAGSARGRGREHAHPHGRGHRRMGRAASQAAHSGRRRRTTASVPNSGGRASGRHSACRSSPRARSSVCST